MLDAVDVQEQDLTLFGTQRMMYDILSPRSRCEKIPQLGPMYEKDDMEYAWGYFNL